MRTIALINQKGGCGKTTSSINLAACLAHIGQRTLLVDMDPQGHCAVGLAVPDQQIEKSVYDILRAPAARPRSRTSPGRSPATLTWHLGDFSWPHWKTNSTACPDARTASPTPWTRLGRL